MKLLVLVPRPSCQVLDIKTQVSRSWSQDPGVKVLVSRSDVKILPCSLDLLAGLDIKPREVRGSEEWCHGVNPGVLR